MTLISGWELIVYLALLASLLVGSLVYAVLAWMGYRKRRSLRGCSQVYGGAIYLGTHRPNFRR